MIKNIFTKNSFTKNSSQQQAAFSADILSTLRTIIAPGGRVRLSPFIESAQFQVLFNDVPRPEKRHEDMRRILNGNSEEIQRLSRLFTDFSNAGKSFHHSVYSKDFLSLYLTYYLPVNVGKLQLILLELASKELLKGEINVVDIGVGAGTTALAFLDFAIAWATVCNLYGVPFPISNITLTGCDASSNCLEFAGKTVHAFQDVLKQRLEALPAEHTDKSVIFQKAIYWIEDAKWIQEDVNLRVPKRSAKPVMVVASNVLNELTQKGKSHIEQYITKTPKGSFAIIIEPGDKNKTQALNTWRRTFVSREHGINIISPCGSEYGNDLPKQCTECWNGRRESMHQSLLYTRFRHDSHKLNKDQRSFSDFENNLLSWSYTCLSKGKTSNEQVDNILTQKSQNGSMFLRYIGAYTSKEPVNYSPDEFKSDENNGWREFIKFCPGKTEKTGLALERKAGFQLPKLNFGEPVELGNIQMEQLRGSVFKIVPRPDSFIRPVRSAQTQKPTFLKTDTADISFAVNEIAYRLFGFPSMRFFQHKVLKRVLAGKNILAIAATGGGKSECFILPAMLLSGVTIVVSPLKSLMQDQYDQRISDRYGLNHLATYLNGDVSFKERQARLQRLAMGYYKLVYMTPEQLERSYVLEYLRETNKNVGIRYLALDEAHCISQWGHDFRPSYLNLVRRLQQYGIYPVKIALTATASPEVRKDLCDELGLNPNPIDDEGDVYVHSSNRPELNFVVSVKKSMYEKSSEIASLLVELIKHNRNSSNPGAAIVFMPHTGGNPEHTWAYLPKPDKSQNSRQGMLSAGVTPFASYLERVLKHKVAIYHGKIEQEVINQSETENTTSPKYPSGDLRGRSRREEQNAFISGKRNIMVATKGFGMGIDKPNIRLVIHRTPPANLEAYAQEAGRAGRDGDFAQAVLLYSPDSQEEEKDEAKKRRTIASDFDIQSFFLSSKYIRREDVVVMRDFLKAQSRKVGDYLYFTNDEVIEFFNLYAGQQKSNGKVEFKWPEFTERKPSGKESLEHKKILATGHLYQEKTRYIERILSILYRIRPDIPGIGTRVAFLEKVQETGAQIKQPRLLNVNGIFNSNNYFGNLLREKLTPQEFSKWVHKSSKEDFLEFSRFIGLSPSETSALFQDIKSSEGRFDKWGNWKPALLDFKFIASPKYGTAAGKNLLDAWREYAGAYRRSNGYANAKKHRRAEPILDDWFTWRDVCNNKGWEVQLGKASKLDDIFDKYLDVFMDLHDRRKENDWGAYRRMLTDYVGVNEDGSLRSKENRNCLRAVMLGYLRTYEVITGDNCLSCSRCVPSGEFEQDIQKRKSVVVSLGQTIVEQIEKLEKYTKKLPSKEEIEHFWELIDQEEHAGKSLVAYVEGWTGRMLSDTPGHQAALWLRFKGMSENRILMQPREFIDNATQLVKVCSTRDLLRIWDEGLEIADKLVPDHPTIYAAQAMCCNKMKRYAKEETIWQISLAHANSNGQLIHQAHKSLSLLYKQGAPLENKDLYLKHVIYSGRTSQKPNEALDFYQKVLPEWSTFSLIKELDWWEKQSTSLKLDAPLMISWLTLQETPSNKQQTELCDFMISRNVLARWLTEDIYQILDLLSKTILKQFPVLATFWLNHFTNANKLASAEKIVDIAIQVFPTNQNVSLNSINVIGSTLFTRLTDEEFRKVKEICAASDEMARIFYEKFYHYYLPESVEAASRWLSFHSIANAENIISLDFPLDTLFHFAHAATGMSNPPVSIALWQHIIQIMPDSDIDKKKVAYMALVTHFSDRLDEKQYNKYIKAIARTTDTREDALEWYGKVLGAWTWEEVEQELELLRTQVSFEYKIPDLLVLWLKYFDETNIHKFLVFLNKSYAYCTWEIEDAIRIISYIPKSLLDEFPPIWNWYYEALALQAQDRGNLPEFEYIWDVLKKISEGWICSVIVYRFCAKILFEQLTFEDIINNLAESNIENLFSRSLFDVLRLVYKPKSLNETVRWVAVFYDEIYFHSPEAAIEYLEPKTRKSYHARLKHETIQYKVENNEFIKIKLRSLIQQLLLKNRNTEFVFDIWKELCMYWPEEIIPYLNFYLSLSLPDVESTIESFYFMILRRDDRSRLLGKFVLEDKGLTTTFSRRIALTDDFIQCIHQLEEKSDIIEVSMLETRHFHLMNKIFKPKSNVNRADMMVALIAYLKKNLNPRWLTPLSFYANTLGLADRYFELMQISIDYPDLTIGSGRTPINEFVAQLSASQRTAPDNDQDYKIIAEMTTKNWKICQ